MKTRSKIVGLAGGVGTLCVLCCTLPILSLLGLGALETFFCENEILKGMGITLLVGSTIYFVFQGYRRTKTNAGFCSASCGCKTN